MKSFLLFFLLAILFLSFFACHKKQEEQPLRVGMDLSYPPFEIINEQGKPDGISVEMSKALSAYLHRPLEIENIPFIGLIPSLQANKIDLIISSMSDTQERRKSIAFSDPYLKISLALLLNTSTNIHSTEELDRPRNIIAVRQGTTGQLWAKKKYKAGFRYCF